MVQEKAKYTEIVSVAIPPLAKIYDYSVPAYLSSKTQLGDKVDVPLGKRRSSGYIVEVSSAKEFVQKGNNFELKAISSNENYYPCFNAEQLEFYRWIANYYQEPLSKVLDTAIPKRPSTRIQKSIALVDKDYQARGSLQKKIIKELVDNESELKLDSLKKISPNISSSLKRLEQSGIIKVHSLVQEVGKLEAFKAPTWAKTEISLSENQHKIYNEIAKDLQNQSFVTYLLHGETGSGKTEIYIELIREVLSLKKSALLLVPEIVLTPQLVDRFAARLGEGIALLHSGVKPRDRWNYWQALLKGECRVVIGARSGIFAPLPNLGLIIVDEEHDSSYKQGDSLRYNARDLAIVRGSINSCPVILGSATPSLESISNAINKKYLYRPLPAHSLARLDLKIEVVDLSELRFNDFKTKNVSTQLFNEINTCLADSGQVFLLFNRRGFASFLQCEKCAFVVKCPNCAVTLTYHKYNDSLFCHYCDYRRPPEKFCTNCKEINQKNSNSNIKQHKPLPGRMLKRGSGTETIVSEIEELFPEARIAKLDRDSADKPEKFKEILDRVRSQQIDILIGTQMIAKGHDLPNVNLVGIIDADVGLHFPDFRAAERVIQLLTQAAGRAGRGEKAGKIIIQTRKKSHLSIAKTLQNDYLGFAKIELNKRKEFQYPPFYKLLRILISSEERQNAIEVASALKKEIEIAVSKLQVSVKVLGPTTAPIQKLRSRFRWHILIKAKSHRDTSKLLHFLKENVKTNKKVRVIYDLDPQDML